MSLTLRVLAPDQSVFDGTTEEVILPSTTGQVGILPGHVTMLAALETGVMRLRDGNGWASIALLGGFAEVESDEVTVLVNGAQPSKASPPAPRSSRPSRISPGPGPGCRPPKPTDHFLQLTAFFAISSRLGGPVPA